MDTHQSDILTSGIDTQALSALLIELNICRRNARSYPEGHPVIMASLLKALGTYGRLMQPLEELVIGVARDALMVGGSFLDKNNQVYRDFARVLFERGIGALVLRQGLTADQLLRFTGILGLRREEIHKQGGIVRVWEQNRLAAILLRPIRYDLFTTTEEGSIAPGVPTAAGQSLWEHFARGLASGQELGGDGGHGGEELDPELLAAVLNRQYLQEERRASGSYVETITDLMRTATLQAEHRDEGDLGKLAAFVNRLNPELRRQFLTSSFDSRHPRGEQTARELIPHLSAEAVIDTLEEVNAQRITLPPVVMGLLQRLGGQGGTQQPGGTGRQEDGQETGQKLRTLFREHASEEFIPQEYQQRLNRIMATDSLPRVAATEVHALLDSLAPQQVEAVISDIILNMVSAEPGEDSHGLAGNMVDMCDYLLETGQYPRLLNIMREMGQENLPADFRDQLRAHFQSPEFLEEVLDGLQTWGKPRFGEIREIMRSVGAPFIPLLLDRLAEESNMSLRRFIMERLMEFGQAARPEILVRLSDSRWYYLRNLLMILGAMKDATVLGHLRPFLQHGNPRVRQEVFRIFLQFSDPAAERQLLLELDSGDGVMRLAAVQMASHCATRSVVEKLLAILGRSSFSGGEYELKCAVVKALAEMGKAEVLPELGRVLGASSLLHAKTLLRLKIEIIHSFRHYPHGIVRPILQRLAAGNDEVARQAKTALHQLEPRPAETAPL